jgi:hypothetical protein
VTKLDLPEAGGGSRAIGRFAAAADWVCSSWGALFHSLLGITSMASLRSLAGSWTGCPKRGARKMGVSCFPCVPIRNSLRACILGCGYPIGGGTLPGIGGTSRRDVDCSSVLIWPILGGVLMEYQCRRLAYPTPWRPSNPVTFLPYPSPIHLKSLVKVSDGVRPMANLKDAAETHQGFLRAHI